MLLRRSLLGLTWSLSVVAGAVAAGAVAGASLPLRTVARLPLSGPTVRFDYASFDSSTDLLWIAHMDADQLLAFDTRRRMIVKTVPAAGVHGVIAVPQVGRVYASATNDHEVLTIDAHSGRILARAPAGEYPDGLAVDPSSHHVFVSDEAGGVETVISAAGRRIATIALGGEAGNVQYDAATKMMLVDVQTRDDIAVINPRTNRLVSRIPLSGCANDHGLLIDSAHQLAFVACDENATLLTLDLRTRRLIGTARVGDSPDVLAFDASLHRLYVSSESGVVAVFAETGRHLEKLGLAFLAPHAHTVAVDPRSHLVYFPLESGTGGRPQLLVMHPR